ncbi:aminotransferase class III-fold pyridoxal phosphate-dependent enzyme [Lichenicoccus sp.]|uniref:aminotransferase class III-fold pyridoxal phosphate-dependent enzyme n=1 Tax=Lichenicoccus sp. TaxID=2781899 RepID=UPI003D12DF65
MRPWLLAVATGSVVALAQSGRQRLLLSQAKHPSLAGHAGLARRVAGMIPYHGYDASRMFCVDQAPPPIAELRRDGFFRLAQLYAAKFEKTNALTAATAPALSDLQFTSGYRVPFQFRDLVREHLPVGGFLAAGSAATVTDLDGNMFHDLTGSYGVNLLGYDVYKSCIARGAERVAELGPVLGAYHPVVAENVTRLRALSGLDEVSFHMSGTEAVMQAVRLARYHTGRPRIVRFCGAYHGWWDDVQPGIGNPTLPGRTLTLAEMSERTLRVLRQRRDIACVLVNPLQALHPNRAAPADGALLDSSRGAGVDRDAYTRWLRALRAVCYARGIVLILDEVFTGFRLARGGAAAYFDVQPDLVTYGKTLGGGLPVGVLCGRAAVMKRFRDDRPVDVCLARGTFNAHPYVMGAMAAFLDHLDQPATAALYQDLDRLWDARASALNGRLHDAMLPVRVANLSSIWTVCYSVPSRYNWMLQYYLRAAGIALSWVGTGRLIFSLNTNDDAFEAISVRFIQACRAMQADGWWWTGGTSNRSLRRQVLREMLMTRLEVLRIRARPSPAKQ